MTCFACGWNERIDDLPPRESVLIADGWRVALAIGCSLPGWLVAVPTRHVQSMDELTEAEAAALGPILRRLTVALREITGCEKTYVALFAEQEGFAHLHAHVVPRMSWFTDDQKGPKSLGVFLGRSDDEATSEADRDQMAMRLWDALEDIEDIEAADEALREIKAGAPTYSWEEVMAELGPDQQP